LLGGFAVFFYADRRAAHKTEATLRAAELDRIRKREIALESRLQAMQARVEPQFLFNTLSQVERLYEIDLAAAERMLDNLIDYLRAAMPLMRRTSSTVAQELELARAYLAIVKARLGERLVFDIDVPAHAGDARLPPMMLLPLIDHAVAYGLGERHDCGRLRIAVEVAGGRLRLAIRDSGAGFLREDASDGVAGVRERLAALYGDDASLVLRCADEGATVAVMDIPFKPVAPDPPDASLAPGVLSQKFA
jgi:LytS/YehU family sensor histidine kinase